MPEIFLPAILIFLILHYAAFLSVILRGLKKLDCANTYNTHDEYISIIIPFRNESANILECLKSITAIDYPDDRFEVIYVNNSSDDNSLELLNNACKLENVSVISVPANFSENAHKKRAIRFGIENSKGSIIFTTDADCVHQPAWLKTMMNCFDENTGFVSGPVEFCEEQSFWADIQKTEFAGLVLTGAGLIGSNSPIICNAANIAYRKSAYDAVNGFKDNMNLSSGDDEFLMQKIWKDTSYKVKFCLSKEAIVKTEVNKTVEQFYSQRKRWASKGLFYADKFLVIKLILIFLYYLSLLVIPLLAVFISVKYLLILLLSIVVKICFEYRILSLGAKLLFSKDILRNFIWAELLQVPYIVIAGLSGIFGNFTWKERKVKR